MKPLNKKDLEKVQGGYSGHDPYGYRSIENPEIGDHYIWLSEIDDKETAMAVGPNHDYEYTSEGWMDLFTRQIVY